MCETDAVNSLPRQTIICMVRVQLQEDVGGVVLIHLPYCFK